MAFGSVLNLSSLNGSNGFAINGVNVSDRSGRSVSGVGDINGDGTNDLIIGAELADPNGSGSGQSYVVFGSSNGWSSQLNLSTLNGSNGFALNGTNADDFSGRSVSGVGDINGDGTDDLIIGAYRADPNGLGSSGQSYVVFGSSNAWSSQLNLSALNGSNGFALNGINTNDRSGNSVSGVGDINGDGKDDLIIGAYRADPNGSESGQSYVVFGSSNGWSSQLNLSTLNGSNGFALNGINASDYSGSPVSGVGDINGDGTDDLIIGAGKADPNGISNSGQSYVVFGSSNGWSSSLNLSTLNGSNGFALNGVNASDYSGIVSGGGDINGDGTDDLIIGAPLADPNGSDSGQSYVVFGSSNAWSSQLNLSTLNGSNGFALNGISGSRSGRSVSEVGDVNGDGTDDLIIGATSASPNNRAFSGQSYVVFGSSNGWSSQLNLSTLNGSNGFALNGVNTSDNSGIVSGVGDVNGDGTDDLIIGAPEADPNGSGSGQSYVVFGQASTSIIEGDNNDNLLNGTSGDDTIIGYGGNDTLNGLEGNDSLDGGADNDTLDGGTGNDTLNGGQGNDTYIIDSLNDVIVETSTETTQRDTVQYNQNYTLGTNLENLILIGSSNIDGVGNELDNIITGNIGNNSLQGIDGDDTLIGGVGADTLDGGDGLDTASYANSSAGVTVNLQANTANGGDATLDVLSNIENLIGTGFDDSLTGNNEENNLDGGAGNDTLNGEGADDTLTGGVGNDTYLVESSLDVISETSTLATEIDTVISSATYLLSSNLENLTLTGTNKIDGIGNNRNNNIQGNSNDNVLNGGSGNDTITGFGGNNTLIGGTGNDLYVVTNSADFIQETVTLSTQIDTVQSSVTYTLGNNLEILLLTDTDNINGTGNSSNNTITGNSGNNTLDGLVGNDTLTGGLGNDTYIIDSNLDVISETSTLATEIDTVISSATYTLTSNLENLILLGASNINGVGNSLDNNITGNSGNNTLNGSSGNDTLTGGLGNDTYILDSSTDVVNETSTITTEIDTVQSTFTYTLSANLENLILLGASNVDGVGNSVDNNITGNSGNNSLDGLAGNDTLTGGLGNDTYILDSTTDVVNETSTLTTEIDTVQSNSTYTLSANLENLILLGASNVDGVGNSVNNSITGNSGNNSLDGLTGNDTLTGGLGNDTYSVDSNLDVISETSTLITEIDSVQSSATYTLTNNLENLVLLGSSNINGVGNSLDNSITGNSGNNSLTGGQGNDSLNGLTGNDTLTGGLGNDTYILDSSSDVVSETSTLTTEIDNVFSSVTYTLLPNLENLILTGSSNLNGVGNTRNNSITGNSGNNTLDGQGGNDTLTGGSGNDTYLVDSSSDVISETSTLATEIDNVQSSATYTLTNNLENLTLTGSSNLEGVGNNLDNSITANSGNNTLRGSQGKDTLIGNVGNDYLGGGDQDDSLVGGVGNDTVYGGFENDSISGGDGNDLLSGDGGKDSIDGGIGNDYIDGGAWYDTMIGGEGNDTYIVDSFSDVINETITTSTEIDEVRNTGDFSLSANLENLILLGTNNIFGTGNSLENIITGNTGDNFLTGGDGADTLTGNDGNDRLKGDKGSDILTGGNGNDTLIGFGGTNEIDTLTGGAGNDVFYLGDSSNIFYNGDNNSGYGLMTDFATGDKIQLKSPSSNYELVKSINFLGSTAKDTAIVTTDGDIIGIVQDDTSLITSLSSNIFIYI